MWDPDFATFVFPSLLRGLGVTVEITLIGSCLLYTSDAADEL